MSKELYSFLDKELGRALHVIELVALACVFVILATFLAPYFVHLSETQLKLLEFIDFAAVAVLFIDLLAHFYLAKNKAEFAFKNWVFVASFLPFGTIFRIYRALRGVKAIEVSSSKIVHVAAHFPKIVRALRPLMVAYSKFKEKVKKTLGLK